MGPRPSSSRSDEETHALRVSRDGAFPYNRDFGSDDPGVLPIGALASLMQADWRETVSKPATGRNCYSSLAGEGESGRRIKHWGVLADETAKEVQTD